MMKRIFFLLFGLLSIFLVSILGCGGANPAAVPTDSTAQGTQFNPYNGGISGVIYGSASTPLAGAYVETLEKQTTSNSSGTYLLSSLNPGNYRILARYSGYSPAVKDQVRVNAGMITKDINLSLSNIATITVAKDFEVLLIRPFYGTDGDEINVIGKGFGLVAGEVTVAGKEASVMQWNQNNDGLIIIKLPTEVETGDVKVIINGESSHETAPVRFIGKPVAIEARPAYATVGEKISIIGRNFNPVTNFNQVTLNGKVCQVLPDSTEKALNVIIPAGAESGTFQVKIVADTYQLDGISSATLSIGPELKYLSPMRSLPGITLSLYGRNFGDDKNKVRVRVGTKTILGPTDFLTFTSKKITFSAPGTSVASPGTSIDISVSVNNLNTASLTFTAVDPTKQTLNSYGIFEFPTVSTSNVLRLNMLAPSDRLAFISVFCATPPATLDGAYGYTITSILGGNTKLVPTLYVNPFPMIQPDRRPTSPPGLPHASVSGTHSTSPVHSTSTWPPILPMAGIPPATTTFWVPNLAASDPLNANNDQQASATFLGVGNSCLVYRDDTSATQITASDCQIIAGWFDLIYPALSNANTFGVGAFPYEGNVDGQTKIVLLITPKIDNSLTGSYKSLAYFHPRDKDPLQPHSAGTEIIYLLDQGYLTDPDNFRGAMAHEFHRMLYFNQKGNQGTPWIEEGLSLFARDIAGYGFQQRKSVPADFVSAYLKNPNKVSLNHWPTSKPIPMENRGMAYLFMEYLYEKTGGYSSIRRLHTQSGNTGLADIMFVLDNTIPPPVNGESRMIKFFNDFGLALYCDDVASTTIPTAYQFDNIQLRTGALTVGINGLRSYVLDENPLNGKTLPILGYGCDVVEYQGGNNGDVEFTLNLPASGGRYKLWVFYFPWQ